MTPEDLAAIQARAEAATKGPWYWHASSIDGAVTVATPTELPGGGYGHEWNVLKTSGDWPPTVADAEFIAHARSDVPALLALVAEKDAEIERLTSPERDTTGLTYGDRQAWAEVRRLLRDSVTQRDEACAALADLHDRIEALHVRRDDPVYEYECLEGDCDHAPEDYDGKFPCVQCPRLAEAVCAHCADQTAPDEAWEHMIRQSAYWPCATLRALLSAADTTPGEPCLNCGRLASEHRTAMRYCGAPGSGVVGRYFARSEGDLIRLLDEQRTWSEETFGPGPRLGGVVAHIRKELVEVEESGGSLAEWIDVWILAMDGAWRTGASTEVVIQALNSKYARNRARTWPDWRQASPDQPIEHVKDARDLAERGCRACGRDNTNGTHDALRATGHLTHAFDPEPLADTTKGDHATTDNGKGLAARYHVLKINDPTGKHDRCRYFVLDPQHDPIAREVIAFYASRTPHAELRRDLHEWLDGLLDTTKGEIRG